MQRSTMAQPGSIFFKVRYIFFIMQYFPVTLLVFTDDETMAPCLDEILQFRFGIFKR